MHESHVAVQLYIAPGMAVFGDIHHDPWNNFRIYGTAFMLVLTVIVAVGVKFVQMFAPISLACVIVSFLSIVIGALLANPDTKDIWWAASLRILMLYRLGVWKESLLINGTVIGDWRSCAADIHQSHDAAYSARRSAVAPPCGQLIKRSGFAITSE